MGDYNHISVKINIDKQQRQRKFKMTNENKKVQFLRDATHTHAHKLENVDLIKRFIEAGKSKFTIVSLKTGKRHTFNVSAPAKGRKINNSSW